MSRHSPSKPLARGSSAWGLPSYHPMGRAHEGGPFRFMCTGWRETHSTHAPMETRLLMQSRFDILASYGFCVLTFGRWPGRVVRGGLCGSWERGGNVLALSASDPPYRKASIRWSLGDGDWGVTLLSIPSCPSRPFYPRASSSYVFPGVAAGGEPGWSWTTVRRPHWGPRGGGPCERGHPDPRGRPGLSRAPAHAPNLRRATERCRWVGKQPAGGGRR